MKRSELLFNIASIPADIISLLLAGLVSFYLRIGIASRLPILFEPNLPRYLHVVEISVIIMLVIFALAGLYNLRATRKFSTEFVRIFTATSLGLLLVLILFFFNQQIFQSRLIILSAWGLSMVFVLIGRLLLRLLQIFYLSHGYGLHQLVIIDGPGAEVSLIDEIKKNPQLGYHVSAELTDTDNMLQDLERLYSERKVEEIMQANPNLSQKTNVELVQFARNHGLVFSFVPSLFDVQRNEIETDSIKGIPYIALKNTPLEGWGRVVKRIFDIVAALTCLIVTSPFFLAIAALIKLDSKGKVLYIAPRIGGDNRFSFYKFRTMYTEMSVGDGYGGQKAEQMRKDLLKDSVRDGYIPKFKNDPRVTRIGRFLRRTKLDEIPQFLNVLKGDMSMVGPRPHLDDEVEKYREKYRRVFTIKPGIFGLTQIAQISWPDLPFEEEMRLNTYYIDNWSIWLDITILAKSFYYLFFVKKSKEVY